MTIHKGVQLHTPPAGQAPVRPLLKWAGGKRQLLPALSRAYPAAFDRYVEPFFGSGAVFFDLWAAGRLTGRPVILADMNPDLIGCYRTVRDRPEDVIRALEALARDHRRGGDRHYYEVRDQRFNPLRASLAARSGIGTLAGAYTPDLAAMLIFLNRTGFNGLFRLNRDGVFNVPVGRYAHPRICQAEHVRAVAEVFGRPGVSIELSPFERTLATTGSGDFVYCDPPYAPLTRTARFASYTADGFDAADQARLAQTVLGACRRGASVVLSNSSAEDILQLYSAAPVKAAGLRIARVPARRAINSRASSRGTVDELIITNVGQGRRGAPEPVIRMAKVTATRARARIA